MSDLPFDQLKDYENQWVALLEPSQEIVGSGSDAVTATDAAKARGYSDVTLFWVPPADVYVIS